MIVLVSDDPEVTRAGSDVERFTRELIKNDANFAVVDAYGSDLSAMAALKPSVVILNLGAQAVASKDWADIRDLLVSNLKGAVSAIRTGVKPGAIYVCGLPTREKASAQSNARIREELNPLLRQMSREGNTTWLRWPQQIEADLAGQVAFRIADTFCDWKKRQSAWKIITASSGIDTAAKAIDGQPDTSWKPIGKLAHWFTADIGSVQSVGALRFVPPKPQSPDFGAISTVQEYRLELSLDGKDWKPAIEISRFAPGTEPKCIFFASTMARYFRFFVISSTLTSGSPVVPEIALLPSFTAP